LAELDAELAPFAGQAHPADQITDLGAHLGPVPDGMIAAR
jgi:hypothetical protein